MPGNPLCDTLEPNLCLFTLKCLTKVSCCIIGPPTFWPEIIGCILECFLKVEIQQLPMPNGLETILPFFTKDPEPESIQNAPPPLTMSRRSNEPNIMTPLLSGM